MDSELIPHIITLANDDRRRFTDIHVAAGEDVVARGLNGWESTGLGEATREEIIEFVAKSVPNWQSEFEKSNALDFALELTNCRLRCSLYGVGGNRRMALSIRRFQSQPMTLEQTGLPLQVAAFARAPKGLMLVTGPTGAGKTTTLAALLDHINDSQAKHIVTIEDPIEYVFTRKKSIITQREVGIDTESFASGLREALRQRPDVIMIGEIRDRDTAATAIRAAESGHFVMATTHGRSAVDAIRRMVSLFGDDRESSAQILSHVLVGIIAQALLPAAREHAYVLACETLFNADQQTSALIADLGKHAQLADAMRTDTLKTGVGMNNVLSRLVREGRIGADQALQASYAPYELRSALEQNRI